MGFDWQLNNSRVQPSIYPFYTLVFCCYTTLLLYTSKLSIKMGLALNCTQPTQSRGSEHQNKNIKIQKKSIKLHQNLIFYPPWLTDCMLSSVTGVSKSFTKYFFGSITLPLVRISRIAQKKPRERWEGGSLKCSVMAQFNVSYYSHHLCTLDATCWMTTTNPNSSGSIPWSSVLSFLTAKCRFGLPGTFFSGFVRFREVKLVVQCCSTVDRTSSFLI